MELPVPLKTGECTGGWQLHTHVLFVSSGYALYRHKMSMNPPVTMDPAALYKTVALCMVSILIETVSYTKRGKIWFESLKQPRHSFSLKIWYIVGAVYYILFSVIAYRLFHEEASFFSTPIILLAGIMLFNGLGNFIIFKYRSVKWFYLVIYPFGLILLTFIIILLSRDPLSALLACIYFFWLMYDLYYGYHLWRLNENQPIDSSAE
jgi:tryptophan-rich sensory protein